MKKNDTTAPSESVETAIFAGGCFWCTEAALESINGVIEVVSGYTGGQQENPDYKAVAGGQTDHREAVKVYYDTTQVDYEKVLEIYWQSIDPFDEGGQFADRGQQYTTAIYYQDKQQKKLAEQSKQAIERKENKAVTTDILAAHPFYEAEEYHQNYHEKNPLRYKLYKYGSGRPDRLKDIWGED